MKTKKARRIEAGDANFGLLDKILMIGLDRCGSECLFCVIGNEGKFVDVANDTKMDCALMERFELTECRSFRQGKFTAPI